MMSIRISEVKMQKSDSKQATTAHRKARSSTTLNRRYVKRPARTMDMTVPVKRSKMVKRFDFSPVNVNKVVDDQSIAPATMHPMQAAVISRMQKRAAEPVVKKMTAKELKDQAIKKALADASKNISDEPKADEPMKKSVKMHFGLGRVMLALCCTAAAVFAIVYFVNLNMPDISMRVAAMQTGIEASYPSYVPKDFNLSSIGSEEGRISLNFSNAKTGDTFYMTEENSSWDSSALLTNFVKNEYGEDYSTIREQGLTIYISGSNATWVNGGVLYKINAADEVLTKQQIRSIAVSL